MHIHKYIKYIINISLFILIFILFYNKNWQSKHKIIKGNILFINLRAIYNDLYKDNMKYMYIRRNWNGKLKIGFKERNIIAIYNDKLLDDEGNLVPYFKINKDLFHIIGNDIEHLSDLALLSKHIKINRAEYNKGLWKIISNDIIIKTHDLKAIIDVCHFDWFNKNTILEIDLRYDDAFLIKLSNDKWKNFLQYQKNSLSN